MPSNDRPSPDSRQPRDRDREHPPAHHHRPAPVDLTEESVAGEEDPGASLDVGDLVQHKPADQRKS
jgi:hypothetical protein